MNGPYGSGAGMTADRLNEILAALRAVPAPPWGWFGDTRGGPILATRHSGQKYVMTFARCGMQGAQPRFPVVPANGWPRMTDAREMIIPRAEYDPNTFRGIDNPVARWIQHSAEYCAELLEELNRRARVLADKSDELLAVKGELEQFREVCSEHSADRCAEQVAAEDLQAKVVLVRKLLASARPGDVEGSLLAALRDVLG